MQVKIMKFMNKIPGGTILVPLLFTALINTFFPSFFTIGGTTTAMFKSSTLVLVGLIMFCSGASIRIKQLPKLLKIGGSYVALKLVCDFVLCFIFAKLIGTGTFLGLSLIAVIPALCSCNPGIFLSQAKAYGDEVDVACFPLVNIVTSQAVAVLVFEITAASATGSFDFKTLLSTLIPFIFGFIAGNLDEEVAKFVKPVTVSLMPFLGLAFGANVNLKNAVTYGGSGIILALIYLVLEITIFFLFDRLVLKRPGYQAVSWCSIAGACAAIPAVLANAHPEYADYATAAMFQLVLAMLLTSICMPIINKWIVNKFGDKKGE